MKHRLFIFGILVACFTYLYGQDNVLISSKQVSNSTEKTKEILQRNATYTSVDFVDINLDKILEYEDFSLQLGERKIPIRKERIDARGVNSYVFVGSNSEGCRVLISVLGNDIQGVIETEGEVFTIKTVGEQQYALMTLDYSQLKEACDVLHEEIDRSSFDDANRLNHDSDIEIGDGLTSSLILRAAAAYDCKIRVLVLYTQNAMSSVSNIKNTILTAVAFANQSFVNSQINYQIELVYAGQTNYTESGNIDTDLSGFQTAGDGYMDEVHTLRNRYSADVCVLLNYIYNEDCGVAADINATEDSAFCVVNTDCDVSYYSFSHEIGHLIGCRHDPSHDSHTTPFAYGHGYVNSSRTWRTIMAYKPKNIDHCPRLLFWSNPNVTHDGEPMGTTATHNNARVWNERSNTVMTFRQPDNNVTFIGSDMPNTQYADVIAKQNITTSGIVNVSNGNTLSMRAGNSINLQPGFSVQTGAEFSAEIEEIDDCGECASKIKVQNVPEEYDDMTSHRAEMNIESGEIN